jgi:hypothetical protein
MRVVSLLLLSAANGFFLENHEDYSTRIVGANPQAKFDKLVEQEVDAGRTLVVRWVAGLR